MPVIVLNGWAADERAWERCRFRRDAIFSYVEQLDGAPWRAMAAASGRVTLVGWSMGGSSALRLALDFPQKVGGLVLVAATPRMMADPATAWRGMNARRLSALKRGVMMADGADFFGIASGERAFCDASDEASLDRGLQYLAATDLRHELEVCEPLRALGARVRIFQSARDGIVRPENAEFLKRVFPGAVVEMVEGFQHALPLTIPERIDSAVGEIERLNG